MKVEDATNQLSYACEAAGALWAAIARRAETGWRLAGAHGLTAKRRATLAAWLADDTNAVRLARPSRALEGGGMGLGPGRVYVFPTRDQTSLLLAGAKALDRRGRAALKSLAAGLLPAPDEPAGAEPAGAEPAGDETPAGSDGAAQTFDGVLAMLREGIPAQAALLAQRVGDEHRVEAIWKMPGSLLGITLAMDGKVNEALARPEGGRLKSDAARHGLGLALKPARKYDHWLIVPLWHGRRNSGLAAYCGARPFTAEDQSRAARQARSAAGVFRRVAAAAEAQHVLARQRILEEMAALTGPELGLAETARRIQNLLLRGFPADSAELLLLTPDGKCLQAASPARKGGLPLRYPLETTMVGAVYRIGRAVRIGNFARQTQFSSPRRGISSKLAAPLELQGQVLGVLALESRTADAFSALDEAALTLLARLAAGIVEYARLGEESARLRAAQAHVNRLGQELSAAQTRSAVCWTTAEWMVSALEADLGLAMLLDEGLQELVAEGVAGRRAEELPRGLRFASHLGTFGEALHYGRSLLIHDTQQSGDYFPVAGWEGGSALCVPLLWRERAVGALLAERTDTYAYDAGDLTLLETAARLTTLRLHGEQPGEETQTALRSLRDANQRLQDELAERKQAQVLAEERLIRSAKLAAVGEMAAGVAHELNNPLTTVAGFAELILEQTAPEAPWRGDLELVLNEARRARAVVRRLLDFSRPSEILRVRADLNEELSNVVSLVHHMASTSGVALRVSLWDDLPPVRIDRNQMQQVFLNLLHNAIQAMPQGGDLTLRTQVQTYNRKKYATASVKDTGVGIQAGHLDKIFEPFFTTKAAGSGTGLGLSVSYGIVADHGGFIDVESEEGKGAVFTVWLPVDAGGKVADE
ncbi:MAG: GAF domain-containing protein [Chloroflexi bacterium]|nr:GAF domain-containing protein [Chloroflexota bacterium]